MRTATPQSAPPVQLERISDYAQHYARISPAVEAAVCGDIRWTYRELARRIDALAKGLLAAGVRPGDRIATLCPPHPDYLVAFLASVSIGAVWLGLNPRYQLDEFLHIVQDSSPSMLFVRTRIGDRYYTRDLEAIRKAQPAIRIVALDASAGAAEGELFSEFIRKGERIPGEKLSAIREQVSRRDPALLVYTSGTTGKPKGALLSHWGLVRCSRVQSSMVRLNPLRILNNLPINHIGCVGDISCYALVSGGTIVFMEKFDPQGILELIQKERITFWGQVPTMFQMCIALPNFNDFDLSSLQLVFWSGAAAPRSLIRRLAEIAPALGASYGMTESVGSVTFALGTADIDVLADSVGWPVEEYEFRIANEQGASVAAGEVGEIQVRGDFIMLGYWQRPEATAETIDADGWLHTRDLAFARPDGTIQLVGRSTEMFKSGGYNVYPREIEQVLEAFPGVAMGAVIGVPDELYGEVGCAYVLTVPGSQLTQADIRDHCRAHLANYKVPKAFVLSGELPMLPIGKIDKTALRKLAAGKSSAR